MELPKNITQVGEADDRCKIYVEDYVVSYLRQMNQVAREKEMAVALYGTCTDEEDKSYIFIYGAAKVNYLQKEVRHLSQAQKQEIEGNRLRYFKEYVFQGYCLLRGEMIEGFYICSQDICRFTKGYAQFYEKNEGMLAYMLEMRQEEPATEVVDQEKYEQVKKRQEERKSLFGAEQEKKFMLPRPGNLFPKERFKNLQFSVVASFAILCVLGLLAITGGQQNALNKKTEEAEPSVQEVGGMAVQPQVMTAQESLLNALQDENKADIEKNEASYSEAAAEPEKKKEEAVTLIEGSDSESLQQWEETEASTQQPVIDDMPGQDTIPQEMGSETQETTETEAGAAEEAAEANAQPAEAVVAEQAIPRTYVIQKGDTLNRISIQNYGSKNYVKKICEANGINNPDLIKIGQKILLP